MAPAAALQLQSPFRSHDAIYQPPAELVAERVTELRGRDQARLGRRRGHRRAGRGDDATPLEQLARQRLVLFSRRPIGGGRHPRQRVVRGGSPRGLFRAGPQREPQRDNTPGAIPLQVGQRHLPHR